MAHISEIHLVSSSTRSSMISFLSNHDDSSNNDVNIEFEKNYGTIIMSKKKHHQKTEMAFLSPATILTTIMIMAYCSRCHICW